MLSNPPAPVADPVLTLLQSVWALAHALDSMSRRMDHTLGVTGPQRVAIRTIAAVPGISPNALSERLRIHPSTTTGLLDRLERKALVRRERRVDDRRSQALFVTESGAERLTVHEPTIEAVIERFFSEQSRMDPGEFTATLDALTVSLIAAADPRSGIAVQET